MKMIRTVSWMMAGWLGLAAGVMGDGLRNPPEGAVALGKIGGKIVYADDASAATHNPANLADQTNVSFMASVTFGYGKKEFTDQLGQKAESTDNWGTLPNLFAAIPLDNGFAAGVSLTTPYGRSTTFDEDSPLRYTTPYYTELYAVNLNPTLAYKVNDALSVAAGLCVLYSDLEQKQIYPWSAATGNPATPDGELKVDADGDGLGYNAAITWKVTDRQQAALTYRSSTKVDYDGSLKISGKPFPFSLQPESSDFSTEIEFPAVVAAGYGIQVTDTVRIEANVEWIQHSLFDKLDLEADPYNQALLPSPTIESDWDDNWTYGFGVDWAATENWTLRAGYIYLETPIPTRTMQPSIAEESQSVISVGAGYRTGDHRVDVAYAYGLFDGRTVSDNTNPAFNGSYDFDAHLIAISYGFSL